MVVTRGDEPTASSYNPSRCCGAVKSTAERGHVARVKGMLPREPRGGEEREGCWSGRDAARVVRVRLLLRGAAVAVWPGRLGGRLGM